MKLFRDFSSASICILLLSLQMDSTLVNVQFPFLLNSICITEIYFQERIIYKVLENWVYVR